MNWLELYQEPGVSGTWTVFDYYSLELVPPPANSGATGPSG